jgi:hypothetical protein
MPQRKNEAEDEGIADIWGMNAVIEKLEVRALFTVLTFDGVTVDGTAIAQTYGDRIIGATGPGGAGYGTAGGTTPNVTVTYGPVGTQAFTQSNGYSDLTNALYPGAAAGGFLDVKHVSYTHQTLPTKAEV